MAKHEPTHSWTEECNDVGNCLCGSGRNNKDLLTQAIKKLLQANGDECITPKSSCFARHYHLTDQGRMCAPCFARYAIGAYR